MIRMDDSTGQKRVNFKTFVVRLANGEPGYSAPIDATNNWWGSQSTGYVNGKIWDGLDNDSLVSVEYMPIKINNQSLIYGRCILFFPICKRL